MNDITNENQLASVKEYKLDMPDIHKIDPIIDKRIRDCHNIRYHTIVNMILNLQISEIKK